MLVNLLLDMDLNSITAEAFYSIPQDVIDKIKVAKEPIKIVVNRNNRQGQVIITEQEYTDSIKAIINLTYADKDKYWQPNIKK